MSMQGFGSDDLPPLPPPPRAQADDDKQQWAARVIQKSYRGFKQNTRGIHANMASPTQMSMMQQQKQSTNQFGLGGTPQEDHAATVIQRNFRKHKRGSGNLHGLTGKAAAAEALHPHSHNFGHGSATNISSHSQQHQQYPYNSNNANNGDRQQPQQQFQPPPSSFWQPGMQVTPARPTTAAHPFPNSKQPPYPGAPQQHSGVPLAPPFPESGGCCSLVCNGNPLWPVEISSATENLLENTDGVGAPHQCSLGAAPCYLLFTLTRAILMPSLFHRPTGYHPNLQKWHLHQLSAPLSEPCCCFFATACPCYYAYDMRSRALKGHYELYKCCQGTVTDVDLYSASCPRMCLMLEACFCTYCAVIATRELLAHQRKLLADPTDNTIQRVSNCLYNQMLCCSMCCSQVDKAQWQHTSRLLDEKRGLHVCAKFLQCCLMPCLQVQTWAQLDVPIHTPVQKTAYPHQQQVMVPEAPMIMKPAWESPHRHNHRRPGGYLDEPKVQHTSTFKRRHNRVYPLTETHPLASHMPEEVVGRGNRSPYQNQAENPDDALDALQAAAVRAAWSTAAVNHNAGHAPRRSPDARSPLNMTRKELDEIDAYNAVHNPNLSPTYNRSRSARRTGSHDTSRRSLITEQPTSERRHLNFKDTLPLDAAEISKAPDGAFAQYQKNKVLEDARRHGEDLLSGHVKPTYATTAESLSHLPTDEITADRVDRGKRRHKAELDSSSAYGASSLSRFAAVGNDDSDDDAGAAMERIEEGDDLASAPPPPPPAARDGMIRRGDGKAARKARDDANAGAGEDAKSHHSSRSKPSSSRRGDGDGDGSGSGSGSSGRRASHRGDAGYTPVRSVSQHGRPSGHGQKHPEQSTPPVQKRSKKKKKPRPPSMTQDAASKILTGATGGWTQTARNAGYSRGHAPDSERAQQFKNEYKSLKEKAYNRGQAL